MMRKNASNDKKNGYLARKERILQEIKYYEKRIAEFPRTNSNDYEISSSESEDDFPTTLDIGPSISELKHQERLLRTCLQATQELTSVGVLQSEVNVMVQDPPLEGEKPTEPGSWREVTAECRIDFVPFSLTFYTYQPSRKFAAASYRGLRVLPVKTSNEAELSKSVLSGLTKPSDAIEVLRSYAIAYRSRRTTLARLADRYAANLSMEPLTEGGFVLKCANLLKMSWRLENQVSPVAPFHHKMNFDLEYMDESYLKIIKQAHRQLSDPSLQTDERTLLLAKIISTCLEAQAPTQELYESMSHDPESIKNLEKTILEDSDDDVTDREEEYQAHKRKRDERNALESTDDEVIEKDNESRKRKRDEEVMAPPKTIPKKAKPKGKENMDDNRKTVKRGNQVDGGNAKKAKTDVQNSVTDTEHFNVAEMVNQAELNAKNNGNKNKKVAPNQKNTVKGVGKELNEKEADIKGKSSEKTGGHPKNSDVESAKVKKKVTGDNNFAVAKNGAKEPKISQDNAKSEDNVIAKKVVKKVPAKTNKVKSNEKSNEQDKKKVNNENKPTKANVDSKSVQKADAENEKVAKKVPAKTDKVKSNEKSNDQDNKKVNNENKPTKASADSKSVQNGDSEKNAPQNTKNTKTAKSIVDKNAKTNEHIDNNVEKNMKNYEKTTASSQAKSKTTENKVQTSKNSEKVKTVNPKNSQNTQKATSSEENKPKGNTKSTNQEVPNNAKKNANLEPAKAKNANSVTTNAKNADPDTNLNSDTQKGSKLNAGSANNKNNEDKNRVNTKNDARPTKNIDNNKNKNGSTKNDNTNAKTNEDKNRENPKTDGIPTKNIDNDKNKNGSTKKDNTNAKTDEDKNRENTKNDARLLKNIGNDNNKNVATKKDSNPKKPPTKSPPKAFNKNHEKSKIVIKHHRNSGGKMPKKSIRVNTMKPDNSNDGVKISKIPQKKLSPTYAAILQQNPIRVSPRSMSKLKSSSDSNIQSKIFKTVTNIPRLKKPSTIV